VDNSQSVNASGAIDLIGHGYRVAGLCVSMPGSVSEGWREPLGTVAVAPDVPREELPVDDEAADDDAVEGVRRSGSCRLTPSDCAPPAEASRLGVSALAEGSDDAVVDDSDAPARPGDTCWVRAGVSVDVTSPLGSGRRSHRRSPIGFGRRATRHHLRGHGDCSGFGGRCRKSDRRGNAQRRWPADQA
jgi:hypothetical protein